MSFGVRKAPGPAEVSGERVDTNQDDPNAAVSGLAGIVMVTAPPLVGLLEQVARIAERSIPGAQGVGVTLLHAGRATTVLASGSFVRTVDEVQYSLMEGPCVTATAQRRTVRSGSLANDPAWPRFGPQVAQLGVHSALSLPLLVGDDVVGAINVYARKRDVFDDHAQDLAEVFARRAAVAVSNAQVLVQARRLTEQLQTALSTQAVIDQAIGILMTRRGSTPAQAQASFTRMSQSDNVTVTVLAQQLVDEAVERARPVIADSGRR